MFGRALRTPLESLRPSLQSAVEDRQAAMKSAYDRRARPRSFSAGDAVLLRDDRGFTTRWIAGEVLSAAGQMA